MNGRLTHCLCCGSESLTPVLDLGVQPLANGFANSPYAMRPTYPLALNVCPTCWHAQLSYCVDRSLLFDDYVYASGTSQTLRRFFAWFAEALSTVVRVDARILEIGANDGSLVAAIRNRGLDCTGIDPAANIVALARSRGLPVLHGRWPQDAQRVPGQYDAIICMNVVAHVDDPTNFLRACRDALAPGGFVLVQPSQARMFERGEFDTLYHEHLSFFNTSSIARLAERAGLRLDDAFLVAIHGDSPVYILRRDDDVTTGRLRHAFGDGEFGIEADLPAYERAVGLFTLRTYRDFGERSRAVLHRIAEVAHDHRRRGFDLVAVGAAAKAMTVMNAVPLRPDLLVDESRLKIGRFAPVSGVLVEPLDSVRRLKRPALFLLAAWNFRDELIAKLHDRGVPDGSRFYTYLPHDELL
jgi:SAM-dependent methyltransferase